ncbi:MAG: hypothetical protein AAGJ46_02475 [Planctomycetota bacterium]
MAQPGRVDATGASSHAAWYAVLPAKGLAAAGPLRNIRGIEILAIEDGAVWLRGPRWEDSIHRHLQAVLGCQVFLPLGDRQLVPLGKSVPYGYEPAGDWRPLREWLTLTPPAKRFAVREPGQALISLVRSPRCEPANLVVVEREAWLVYAATAPQVRLDRLVFASSGDHAVVTGRLLPPLRGEYYWVRSGIAAPVGFTWSPAVAAPVLRRAFQLDAGDVLLITLVRGHCLIRGDQFVGASHSAARLTREAGRVQP